MKLENVRICYSPLSGRIVVARFGNDKAVALDSRDAMDNFLQVLTAYAFEGKMPDKGEAAEVEFGGGDEQFTMTITRKASAATDKKSLQVETSTAHQHLRSVSDMERVEEIISNRRIDEVHANASFGGMSKRDVIVNSLLKYAFGYSSGHTALCICEEHGLVRKHRPRSDYPLLTKKGKRYLRAAFGSRFSNILTLANHET